jgi:hypothetical protein
MTQINILRVRLVPPPPSLPSKDLLLILGVWFLVMGTVGTLLFLR